MTAITDTVGHTVEAKSERQPGRLWHLAVTYALFTFAFGTINSLLVLYLVQKLQFSSGAAYSLFAAFNSLMFTLPLIGGYFAVKFGYRPVTFVGLVICLAGLFCLSLPSLHMMYLGLAIFTIGNGMFTPTLWCLVGFCYDKEDKRRDSGYTLFYIIFNAGFVVSTFLGGYLVRFCGYNTTFFIGALVSSLSILLIIPLLKSYKAYPGRSIDADTSLKLPWRILIVVVLSVIGIPFAVLLLQYVQWDSAFLWFLALAGSAGVLILAVKQPTALAKFKLIAFLILSIASVFFWSLYMLEPSLITIFIDHNVQRNIANFVIPPSAYYGLDPFFILTLGLFFSWLWKFLSKRGKDLSLPTKFSLSLLFMGSGYWLFTLGIHFANAEHLTNMSWIIFGYLCLTTAELLLSPIGMSMVGRLSPRGKEGALMGMWQLFTGLSAVISGYLARSAVVPDSATPQMTNPIYMHTFFYIGLAAIAAGVVMVLCIPLIKGLINR